MAFELKCLLISSKVGKSVGRPNRVLMSNMVATAQAAQPAQVLTTWLFVGLVSVRVCQGTVKDTRLSLNLLCVKNNTEFTVH